LLASRLFIETYQRSQRLQIALDSRGYTGANPLRVLPLQFRYDSSLLGLGSLALVSLVFARLVL
jgi:energy-coupling factor transporter transmembrane protein EcfT